jgi:hypothetical protein
MSKTEINVEPIIASIREKVTHINGDRLALGDVKVLKGQNRKEGHFLIMIETSNKMRLDIDIDCNELLRNPKYLDSLIPDIYAFFDSAMEARQECLRMAY